MVEALVASGAIQSSRVRNAFAAEPLELYVTRATHASDGVGETAASLG
jgi:hypothetical protein